MPHKRNKMCQRIEEENICKANLSCVKLCDIKLNFITIDSRTFVYVLFKHETTIQYLLKINWRLFWFQLLYSNFWKLVHFVSTKFDMNKF